MQAGPGIRPDRAAPAALAVYLLLLGAALALSKSLNAAAVPTRDASSAPVRADFRLAHASLSAECSVALRNGSWNELAGVLTRVRNLGGYPEWLLEYGRRLLESCPDRALLVTGSLADTAAVRWWQAVRRFRRDVAVLPAGYLDRVWFTDLADARYGLLRGAGESPVAGDLRARLTESGCYNASCLDTLCRMIRRALPDRAVMFSMDLPPRFLRPLSDRLSVRGCAFRLHPLPVPDGPARVDPASTAVLFRDPDRLAAARGAADAACAELDSVRRHYAFAAGLLRRFRPGAAPESVLTVWEGIRVRALPLTHQD
jgi:hypothetical protein